MDTWNDFLFKFGRIKGDIYVILEYGVDDYWWASEDSNFKIYNTVRVFFGLEEKLLSDRREVLERLR